MEEAIQISKNFIKGDLITDPKELFQLVADKKSVYHSNWGIKPASVIVNMSFYSVMKSIKDKSLYKTTKFKPLKIGT